MKLCFLIKWTSKAHTKKMLFAVVGDIAHGLLLRNANQAVACVQLQSLCWFNL